VRKGKLVIGKNKDRKVPEKNKKIKGKVRGGPVEKVIVDSDTSGKLSYGKEKGKGRRFRQLKKEGRG